MAAGFALLLGTVVDTKAVDTTVVDTEGAAPVCPTFTSKELPG